MPLTTLPDQGIELPLSEYNRLRAFQGGGWFWDHDNQQVIREVLGDFLPRVEERRDRGGALFQHFVGATEAASRSQAVGAQMNRVPRAEYQRLQRALDNLKRKAQDPGTDPNARKVIEKFCLPDPAKDPDLYRLYGTGWNRRLLVLWGCEREEGSSLAPVAALNKIAIESPATTFFRRLPMLLGWLLLLILLVLAGYWWWQHHDERADRVATTADQSATATTDSGVPAVAGQPAAASPAASVNPPASTSGNPTSADQQSSVSSAHDANETGSTNRTSDTALKNTAQSGLSTGTASRDSTTTPDSQTAMRDPASAKADSERSRTNSTAVTGQNQAASGSTQDARAAQASDRNRATDASSPAAGSSPAAVASSPSNVSPANLSANRAETLPPASVAKAATPGAPPKVEILKAQSSSTPHDGKMDVVIMATAKASDGSLRPLEIKRWSVDDRPEQDPAGHDLTTGQLNLTLTPGKHHVSVMATAHGVPVEGDTDLDVEIKSQGDVTLKPRDTK